MATCCCAGKVILEGGVIPLASQTRMSKTPDLGSLLLAEEEGEGVVFLEGARKGCCAEEEEGGRGAGIAGAEGVGACSLFSDIV